MLHYHQIEFLAHERQAELRTEAEARRQAKAATTTQPTATKRLRPQVGARLVQWGATGKGNLAHYRPHPICKQCHNTNKEHIPMTEQANPQPTVRNLSCPGQRQHFALARPYRRTLLALTVAGGFLVITLLLAFMPVANAMSQREHKINQNGTSRIEAVVQQPARSTPTATPPMPTSTPTPVTEPIDVDQKSLPKEIFAEKTFKVSGTAKGNAEVKITKDDVTKTLVGQGYADAAGKWTIDVKVTDEGTYKLEAKELVNGTTDTVTIAVVASPPNTPTPTN